MTRDANPSQKSGLHLVNVNSHSLGVVGTRPRTGKKVNAILIPKNTPLPCRNAREFKTGRPNQTTVKVEIVEGENARPEHCIPLGKCVIRNLPPNLPKGTRVHVEYRYASNGRISVSAHVPAVRLSAQVEIQREHSRDLQDLDTWRRRLLGVPEGVSVDASDQRTGSLGEKEALSAADRSVVIERLDALYLQAGVCAAKGPVPAPLGASREHALSLAERLRRAKADLRRAEAARQAAVGEEEAFQLDAKVCQAKVAAQHAETQSRFAYLVLGRECIAANYVPPDVDRYMAEIRQLQQSLSHPP